jgi:hypothetical protein
MEGDVELCMADCARRVYGGRRRIRNQRGINVSNYLIQATFLEARQNAGFSGIYRSYADIYQWTSSLSTWFPSVILPSNLLTQESYWFKVSNKSFMALGYTVLPLDIREHFSIEWLDNRSIRMKMNMEHWWNDTDRGKLKYWERNIIQRWW